MIFKNIIGDLTGINELSEKVDKISEAQGIDTAQTELNSKAKDNWRYVGFIPTKQRGTGHIAEIELVFEKKESEKE